MFLLYDMLGSPIGKTFLYIFDIGGIMLDYSRHVLCLNDYLAMKKPDLTMCLRIFIALVRRIQKFHTKNQVYNDLNPGNILIDPATNAVTLVPSELSVTLKPPQKISDTHNKRDSIQGQLSYISPEQAGRTAYSLDFRSDYYSLGVILYQLLTGAVPFDFEQPLRTIHAHIAVVPKPAVDMKPNVPIVLSHIADKLLAKNPNDRYQSIAGLIADLETCLLQIKTAGTVQSFAIAQKDVSPFFEIPQKLYGRYKEIQLLLDACNHVRKEGIQVIFLSGPPGIGKSFLVNQVQSHLSENDGYFISGKFNQYEASLPCSAIIEAFAGLIRRILTLSDRELSENRLKILNAVGDKGQLIINVIPELELIIGKQAEPEKLSLIEARNRFNYIFQKFVRAITDIASPLIIFMDDLHWAENASLNLLETVLSDAELRNVLFIGSYRDIEGKENVFLGEFLERIDQKRKETQFVALGPVDNEYVELLIEETVAVEENGFDDFIELVVTKTSGNPLFIREFLISLYEEGVLRLAPAKEDSARNRWRIDTQGALAAKLPDTVAALLTKRVQKLADETRDTLNIAACIGTRFSSSLIATVNQKNSAEIEMQLKQAIDQGIVFQTEDGFKFIHDRVREAAYQLTGPEERTAIHYAIGKALLVNISDNAGDAPFMVASQLNSARQLLDADERGNLLQLNFAAGKKAKRMTAYKTAADYFNISIELMDENAWQTHYDMALRLYNEAAETAYLNADAVYAEKLVTVIIQHTPNLLDQMHAYEIRLRCLISQHKFSDATNEGLRILERLGYTLPKNQGKLQFVWQFIVIGHLLRKDVLRKLDTIKMIDDPKRAAFIRIINVIGIPLCSSHPNLLHYMSLIGLKSSLVKGSTPQTASLLAFYSSFLCAIGKTETGYQLAQTALLMIKPSHVDPKIKSTVLLSVYCGLSWKAHIRETLAPLIDTYTFCMETGNLENAACAAIIHCNNCLNVGMPLPDILSKLTYYVDIFEHRGQKMMLEHLRILQHTVSFCMGVSTSASSGQTSRIDIKACTSSGDMGAATIAFASRMLRSFFDDSFEDALKFSSLTIEALNNQAPNNKPILLFYDSLIRLALIRTRKPARKTFKRSISRILKTSHTKRYHLRKVAANQKKLRRAADYSPVNFLNKWLLVEAERANAGGRKNVAETCYQNAIDLSKEHRFVHEEALANELFAKHLKAHSAKKAAEEHFKAAIALYGKWGCEHKKVRLLTEYLATPIVKNNALTAHAALANYTSSASSAGVNVAELDLQLFSNTLHSFSRKTDLETYLQHLSKNVMHFAGAQRVLLLLNRDTLTIGVDNRMGKEIQTLSPISGPKQFPDTLVTYVIRTQKPLLITDATAEAIFADDPYIQQSSMKSICCMPLLYQNKLCAIMYLENSLSSGVFTTQHQETLMNLGYQIALFLENEFLKDLQSENNRSSVSPKALQRILQEQYSLTPQESNISMLLKNGFTRAQICDDLNISANTLRRHLQMIYEKTVNLEDDYTGSGRVDKLSRLILFLFKLCETSH